MILFCGCGNGQGAQFQDARYGKGQRVHNPMAKADKAEPKFRCTLCGIERGKPTRAESKSDEKKTGKKLALSKS